MVNNWDVVSFLRQLFEIPLSELTRELAQKKAFDAEYRAMVARDSSQKAIDEMVKKSPILQKLKATTVKQFFRRVLGHPS